MKNGMHQANVAVGNFFFKYRNGIFPVVLLLLVFTMRPRILLNLQADRFLATVGFWVALAGELVRLATIGFEYIERGGKKGRVYASSLVQKGVYGLTRNPMYAGNLLIVIGIVMASGAPLAYWTVIPFFCFVYQAIITAEENFLRSKFGSDYETYAAHVPRFLPSFRGFREAFDGVRFNWRRPFKQDLSTIAWVMAMLVALPCWRAFFLYGWDATQPLFYQTARLELSVTALYGFLILLKRRKSPLFYSKDARTHAASS